jgi:pimeloyl-ACP methyl ester carboxylesterase
VFTRRTTPILGRDRTPHPGSIAQLERVRIGGVDQWILLRGVDDSQPVLLIVPDGPGETLIPLARAVQAELERAFVVVNWDPRGSGLSYDGSAARETLTLERMVQDTVELARHVVGRLGRDRIVLAGHGFGSVPALLAAARAPELFESYIGVAQWVEPIESERRSLTWARTEAERRGRSDLLSNLARLDDPDPTRSGPDPALLRALRTLGAEYENPQGRVRSKPSLIGRREYTALDLLVRRPRGIRRSAETVGREVRSIDLVSKVTRLGVPAFFLSGRSDHVVDPNLAREYIHVLEAPRKGWAWVEETAHLAPFEDPEAYAAALAHFAHDARGPVGPQWAIAG